MSWAYRLTLKLWYHFTFEYYDVHSISEIRAPNWRWLNWTLITVLHSCSISC